jgi:methionyl aminopeptidase
MSQLKSDTEIQHLREGGKRLSRVLDVLEKMVAPGVATQDIDTLAEKLIREGGDVPAFKDYQPAGASYPYPATVCISVNEEIVHGLPGSRVLKEGDVVGLDIGLSHEGLIVDMARTVPVGAVSPEVAHLLEVTKAALKAGIKAAKVGKRIGDIAATIQAYGDKEGYGIVRELGGHGVGHAVHELPFVPNYGKAGTGPLLKENMVLALEPMFNLGSDDAILAEDGYTYKTSDGSVSAHFEHTIVLTKKGPEVVTVS